MDRDRWYKNMVFYQISNLKKSPEERLRKMWRSSRDSARTPVQWDATRNAGFTTGKPWFYINPNYTRINVAAQEQDPDSLLNFYREAIRLRKSLKVVRHGSYREHFRMSAQHYVYSREMPGQKLLVVCSFTDKPSKLRMPHGFDVGGAKLILRSHGTDPSMLQPYESRVYLWESLQGTPRGK